MELWTSTQKTILAAAFGTLGVVVRKERALDERTGKTFRRFHLSDSCVENKIRTQSLKTEYESGRLLANHPDHPILDIIYAKQNRDRLLDALEKGRRIQFRKQSGADRTFYISEPGTSFPGVGDRGSLLASSDLNIVAALARFGVPVLEVRGPRGARKFYLDALQRLTTPGKETAAEILRDWRAGEIPAEHPFAYAALGLINYGRLIRGMEKETEQVLIRKPNSEKSAILDPQITGKGLDQMRRFFLG